jgi:ABC-type sugar transport system ATPase subunit
MSNLILIAGGTGQGKSFYTNKHLLGNDIREISGKDNYFQSISSKRQYIFDINNEYQFPDDSMIRPIMRNVNCNDKQFVENCKRLTKTNIVFEDASGFLRGKQSKEIARLIVQRRHSANNYIILFHSINRIPPELLEYCNYLLLFKTGDNLKDIDNKFKNQLINRMFLTLKDAKEHSHIIKRLL